MTEEHIRDLINKLGRHILKSVNRSRSEHAQESLSAIEEETEADTIYKIDKLTEEGIFEWLESSWPITEPVALVMEGLSENELSTFPKNRPPETLVGTLIIDPIDGTRNIMYDKRSAWALVGFSRQIPPSADLQSIEVASMTELPTSRAWRADQVSAIKGKGRSGVIATTFNVMDGTESPACIQPSSAKDLQHSFASMVRFFPEGKALSAKMEETLLTEVIGKGPFKTPLVFEDQYPSTGGQIFEIISGKDRFIADLRPLIFNHLGYESPLSAHPYDISSHLIATELGCIITHPDGSPLNAPLDLTTPVAWCGFANEHIARLVSPALKATIQQHLA